MISRLSRRRKVNMELNYEQFFEVMPAYLTILDRDLRVIAANQRFRKDFGDYEGRLLL